jgi:hypothetical protein
MNPQDLRAILKEEIFRHGLESVSRVEQDYASGAIGYHAYQMSLNSEYLEMISDGR